MNTLEQTILANLIDNEEFVRKTIPFLKNDYFHNTAEQTIFQLIAEYFIKYNKPPSKEALFVDLEKVNSLDQSQTDEITAIIKSLQVDSKTEFQWLIDRTELFCQDKAIYNALHTAIQIADGKNKKLNKNAIPKILTDALAVSFDTSIGHDFLEDSDKRYEYYHKQEHKIPFDLDMMNKITKNGVQDKTLNLIIGGTGVGKTLCLCHFAAHYLLDGLNVLYITLEISEEEIGKRIDANLLNVTLDDLLVIPKDSYDKQIGRLKKAIPGKLIVREYAATTVGVIHFRHLLDELKIKKNFVPDVIFVDSLNLCVSSRFKQNGLVDLYQHGKNIAEELRGLAVEHKIPLWSAVQFNRQGFASSDPSMDQTGESWAVPQTTDLYLGLIANEGLQALNQIMVKQLKNRYRDESLDRRFVIGVDKTKMRLYNTEQSAQSDIVDDEPMQEIVVNDDKRTKNLMKAFKDLK